MVIYCIAPGITARYVNTAGAQEQNLGGKFFDLHSGFFHEAQNLYYSLPRIGANGQFHFKRFNFSLTK